MERLRVSNLPVGARPFAVHADPVEPAHAAALATSEQTETEIQPSLAQAFVINQSSAYPMYTPCEALCRGTLFASLYKPFSGGVRCETR